MERSSVTAGGRDPRAHPLTAWPFQPCVGASAPGAGASAPGAGPSAPGAATQTVVVCAATLFLHDPLHETSQDELRKAVVPCQNEIILKNVSVLF